ncbi:MAG: hypothetical protein PHR45_07235 [Muribaculaceae bacterium]|nr:hypothetical protein [Muribaculaceae bacterium]
MEISLQDLINAGDISPRVLALLQRELLDVLADLDYDYTLTAENILFSENYKSVYLRQLEINSPDEPDFNAIISNYAKILQNANKVAGMYDKNIEKISCRCLAGEFSSIPELQLAIERRLSNAIYIPLILFLALLMFILNWLSNN